VVGFEVGGDFAVGQAADFIAAEEAVFTAAANEDAAVFEAVEFGAAADLDADEEALRGFDGLPATDDGGLAHFGGDFESAFGFVVPDWLGRSAVFLQTEHDEAAIAISEGYQAFGHDVRIGFGQES